MVEIVGPRREYHSRLCLVSLSEKFQSDVQIKATESVACSLSRHDSIPRDLTRFLTLFNIPQSLLEQICSQSDLFFSTKRRFVERQVIPIEMPTIFCLPSTANDQAHQ
ncbi:hypothetical protein AC1031_022009 [Aphanomyces cochlioides]|nr:hypothetical protein AC1031_022009 [Aphanomyces cochlioides]